MPVGTLSVVGMLNSMQVGASASACSARLTTTHNETLTTSSKRRYRFCMRSPGKLPARPTAPSTYVVQPNNAEPRGGRVQSVPATEPNAEIIGAYRGSLRAKRWLCNRMLRSCCRTDTPLVRHGPLLRRAPCQRGSNWLFLLQCRWSPIGPKKPRQLAARKAAYRGEAAAPVCGHFLKPARLSDLL